MFYHFKERSVLKSYFQISGWTPEKLDRAGVALIERGDTSLSVYGRTHFLFQEGEEYDEFAAAAAFGDAAALARICINETVAYIEARSKPTYPGGKTLLHFCLQKMIL